MNIQFQKKDAEYYGIEIFRKDIAKMTCKHPVFIEIVATVLLELCESSNNLTKELCKIMELYDFMIDDSKKTEYIDLKNKLVDYFIMIQDFDFDSKLRAYNPNEYQQYGLFDNQKKMNVFRGILFEAIVEELAYERFKVGQFETGCCVIINGKTILVHYENGRVKETFDIVGWNCAVPWGEFYECKLRPNKFKLENYELMLKLENYLKRNRVLSFKIIVASADAENNVLQQIRLLEETMPLKLSKLECYGRETIQKIYEISVPIIA